MKKNKVEEYESIKVFIDEVQHPIAFKNKLEELIECGMTEKEARKFIMKIPIELEIYYEKHSGLFGVEAEAVECGPVYSAYSGKELEENED